MWIKFIGDPAEIERGGEISRQHITMPGVEGPVTLYLNQPVEASRFSDKLLRKLRGNSHFEIFELSAEGADEPPVVAPIVRKGRKASAEE